ncbi:hypothetical protein [Microbacterium sp. Leaf179]|uniref:hypothetical protein n=1 Tax=Microbacterium sp. Leaf179 TaxID=1736288 RepID=UPI000700712C|nr:hypothetical protein [Microbacterium sp. Leaf179]KQR85188.1 hypothetical protein ASF96_14725 [Microbacterium sp. Leaf179]
MADPNTITAPSPIAHLTAKGFPTPPWSRDEHLIVGDDGPRWNYRTTHLSSRGVQDLAWLLVDGWDVNIQARGSHTIIRIHRKATA